MNGNNKYLIAFGVLIIFCLFVGFVAFSLYSNVTDKEKVIIDNKIYIDQLIDGWEDTNFDLNNTASDLVDAQLQINLLNANINQLAQEKNNIQSALNQKIIDYDKKSNDYVLLDNKYAGLNNNYIDLNSKYNTTIINIIDVNNTGKSLYGNFLNCYWAIKCAADVNGCKGMYGQSIDTNAKVTQKTTECLNIGYSDLNIYKKRFE